jgi:trans-aconitate 2-methyltransferase
VPGQPGDPAEHLQWLHVQVGPLGPPGSDQIVHLVALHTAAAWTFIHARSISLDIKSVASGHLNLLTSWAGWLAADGWLAVQLPGNFDQPSHTILRDLAASARWRPLLDGVRLNRQAMDPGAYLDVLAAAECEVDAWETTYLHVLHGENAVLGWYRGSGLRPVLAALTP